MSTIRSRWLGKLHTRKKLEADGRARHEAHPTKQSLALLKKRKSQVAAAERVLRRHPIQRIKSLRAKAWDVMASDIAAKVSEVGGNNRGREVEKRIRANGGTPGEPWCGDEVAYCYLKAGAKSVTRSWASVRLLEKLLMRVRFSPGLGHVVTYVFDHTGLFKRFLTAAEVKAHDLDPSKKWFFAGEGNTGNVGAVSDSVTGTDGVKLKIRSMDQVAGIWRVLR